MFKKSGLVAAALTLWFSEKAPAMEAFLPCTDRQDFTELADSDCATVSSALHATDPNGEKIKLFVRKFPAKSSSKGEVWLIAGGPGEAGSTYYAHIGFFRDTFPEYDLMVPDHRGTGFSSKLCEPEETPESDGGFTLVGAEWGSCFGQLFSNPARTQAFTTTNAAQDLNSLIGTLGSGRETYVYAVSYGTALALRFAELATVKVDGIMLDSLVPHRQDGQNDLSHRSHTTHEVGSEILKRCEEEPDCVLGPVARRVYGELLSRIDAGEQVPGLEAIPGGNIRLFLGTLVGSVGARTQIPAIIHALSTEDPNASLLITAALERYAASLASITKFPQSAFSIPLSSLMSGSEYNLRPELTQEELVEEEKALDFTSPLPGLLVGGNMPFYDKPSHRENPVIGPRLIVLQGTLDEKTPYQAAVNHIKMLSDRADIRLITLTDAAHGVFFMGQSCLKAPLKAFIRGEEVTSGACASETTKLVFN